MPVLATYEHRTGGRAGLYAVNLATGRHMTWRAQDRFVMCSTFKLSLAAMILTRVDRGLDSLEDPVRFGARDVPQWHAPVARANLSVGQLSVAQMCQAAVEQSDNTCATLLLKRIGGPAALTGFWRGIGDKVSRLDHEEPLLNATPIGAPHDTTTPLAMAGNVRLFTTGSLLSPASRQRITDWMIACRTGGNRLRGGLPKDWRIGDKTGNNGADAAGDLAIAWTAAGEPIVIACYTRGGKPTEADLETLFAGVGMVVADRLGS